MIEVRDLHYAFGAKEVLKGVSFSAQKGEFVAILGNNGTGKSTLMLCLNKIREPKAGTVTVNEQNVLTLPRKACAKLMSYVAQKAELSDATVYDTVMLGRLPYMNWQTTPHDHALCEAVIEKLNLESLKMRSVSTLSGGEQQKVMLARALVQEPEVLLLDEPTSSLDIKNAHEMLSEVRTLCKEASLTVLMVIHDLNLALRYCDKFLFLKDGEVYRFGDKSVITEEVLEAAYGIPTRLITVDGETMIAPVTITDKRAGSPSIYWREECEQKIVKMM